MPMNTIKKTAKIDTKLKMTVQSQYVDRGIRPSNEVKISFGPIGPDGLLA